MNDERERREGRDPVADFFARERDSIRPEPADDLRWQRIVGEARRGRRSRWLATVGGAAAAAVIASAVAFGPQLADSLSGHSGQLTPATRSAAQSPGPSPTLLQTPEPTAPQGTEQPSESPTTVPSAGESSHTGTPSTGATGPERGTFVAGSLSNSGKDRLYLLGTSLCGDARCPVLQTSSDNGKTWHVVHTFSARDGDLTQVRFANPNVGWVYGSDAIKVTRDGGRSWADYAFAGDRVFDLESNGDDVIVASSSECRSGTCAGKLEVSRTPVGQAAPNPPSEVYGGLQGAQVSTSKTQTLVVPRHPAGSQDQSGPWWLDGPDLVNAGRIPGNEQSPSCGATDTGAMVVGANDPDLAASLCPTDDPQVFTVDTTHGDDRWKRLGPTLRIPGEGRVSLAFASKSHLLAMRGDALRVSTDGGISWHEPAAPPPSPEQGFAWIGAPGGTQLYAVAQDQAGYWVSDDWGEHWREVAPER